MVSKRVLVLSGITLAVNSFSASAQQPLPRPIVLYRSVQNTIPLPQPAPSVQASQPGTGAMTAQAFDRQWANSVGSQPRGPVTINTNPAFFSNASPDAAKPNSIVAGVTNGSGIPIQQASQIGSPQNGVAQNGQPNQANSPGQTPEQQWMAEQQSRPTLQAMQNPSGAQNMTHNGFTNAQQIAPNTYLGAQFQNWTNQQPVSQMSASFGEMNRMQPGPFGGYVGPNTFIGTGYASWSNLTQGGISPGNNGSWDFSVWP